jgi:hypothetical protein
VNTSVEQPVPPQEALEWERANRTRSGWAAVAAAVLTFAGSIGQSAITSGIPHILAVDAYQDAVGERPAGSTGLKTAQLLYTNDHALGLILVGIALALGSALMAPALAFLYRAAAARSARTPRIALYAALIGPIVVGVAGLILQVVIVVKANQFAGQSNHGTAAAHEALSGPMYVGTTILRGLGTLVVALGIILVALAGMRTGLLTRFMGIIGVIAGAMPLIGGLVAPQLAALPVLQIFWLAAVGALMLGRWPGGNIPRAWETGQAEPWPTQQEIREQRARDAEAREAGLDPRDPALVSAAPIPRAEPDEDDDEPAGTPHSSSKKKKRKRR